MKALDDILQKYGENRSHYFNAIAPPIIQSSNFAFDSIAEFKAKIIEEYDNHVYSRGNNPTVEILRKKVAALENAEDALITSSGSAAIACAVINEVKAGDHVICVNKPYSWTGKLLADLLHKFGVKVTFVDARFNHEIETALQENTTLLYLESPNSITFEIQDLKWCAQFAKANDLITIIDNSHASPIYQNPIDYGIDIVVHSGSKYLNGHSDVVVGAICGRTIKLKEIFSGPYMTIGSIISPFEAWLVIRGLRTIDLRLKKSDENAHFICNKLQIHPKIKKVIHPLFPSHPQYTLAKSQMKGNGGLFTIELDANSKSEVESFISAIKNFKMAVSWGGYESLMVPSIVFHDMPDREDSPIPWTFIRFYAGIENKEYLLQDILNALDKIN